jgi:hypothetical protein
MYIVEQSVSAHVPMPIVVNVRQPCAVNKPICLSPVLADKPVHDSLLMKKLVLQVSVFAWTEARWAKSFWWRGPSTDGHV